MFLIGNRVRFNNPGALLHGAHGWVKDYRATDWHYSISWDMSDPIVQACYSKAPSYFTDHDDFLEEKLLILVEGVEGKKLPKHTTDDIHQSASYYTALQTLQEETS